MPVYIKMSLEILGQENFKSFLTTFRHCRVLLCLVCWCLITSCEDSLFQIKLFCAEQGILMN